MRSLIQLNLLFLMIIAFSQNLPAQGEPQTISLWNGKAPAALGQESKDDPTGLLYLLPKSNEPTKVSAHGNPCLVILPGGGYGNLAIDHEGYQIAKWANSMGMVALICKYRNRRDGYGHPVPIQDAQRALRMARFHADKWEIDKNKVGIIGFSAGGHLASTVLTHFDSGVDNSEDPIARQSSRPDVGILCYPVIGMGKPYSHAGSQKNLFGPDADSKLIASLSNEDQVTPQSPPTFIFHTQEDKVVHPENSLAYYSAMVKNNVPGELHFFQKGKHGVGLGSGIPGTEKWPELCRQWLLSQGMCD